MEQIITTTVVTLISGAIGAIIGTYGGALFAAKRQEKHIKELRQVAIKALKIFQKYARNRQTYDVAASEFNNALSIAEKRVFIVALHKLGIPILATPDSKFDIQNIVFEKREIDKDEIEAIISQIQLGHCDQLFYIEPDNYFSENIRLKTLRYIAKRWVREVFGKSKIDETAKMYNIDTVSKLPINPEFAALCDSGKIENFTGNYLDNIINKLLKI